MAQRNLNKSKDDSFDFANAVAVKGPLNSAHLKKAKAKVLKSVRYDSELLAKVQKLSKIEGIPYQTLMNSLLKAGLEAKQSRLIERVERIEKKLFKKIG